VLFVVGAFTVSWHQVNPAWLAAFILVALLLTGLVSKKDFQQKIDWPMIFFLLSLEGLSRSISYLGLDTALSAAVGDRFDFVGGNLMLFIPVALAVTLVLRLALPITAGMVVAAVVLMPVAVAQNIHPWVLAFLTAMFSDMWFKPYQSSQCLQLASSGYAKYIADPGFRRYNHFMNASRIVAAYASVPYWQWLGLA
jgi:divalent anion:Na+ symporter, DASS family